MSLQAGPPEESRAGHARGHLLSPGAAALCAITATAFWRPAHLRAHLAARALSGCVPGPPGFLPGPPVLPRFPSSARRTLMCSTRSPHTAIRTLSSPSHRAFQKLPEAASSRPGVVSARLGLREPDPAAVHRSSPACEFPSVGGETSRSLRLVTAAVVARGPAQETRVRSVLLGPGRPCEDQAVFKVQVSTKMSTNSTFTHKVSNFYV